MSDDNDKCIGDGACLTPCECECGVGKCVCEHKDHAKRHCPGSCEKGCKPVRCDICKEYRAEYLILEGECFDCGASYRIENTVKQVVASTKYSIREECCVCLEMKSTSRLRCRHLVCDECWGEWSEKIRGMPTCPICRDGTSNQSLTFGGD